MQVFYSLSDLQLKNKTAVTLGKFDGVHRGHELLMDEIRAKKTAGLDSLVVGFKNNPKSITNPKENPAWSVITTEEQINIFEKENIDYLVLLDFDEEIRNLLAKDFVSLLITNLNMGFFVCGSDFRFGKGGLGNVEVLQQLSAEMGFDFKCIEKLKDHKRDISSTFIREELSKGNIDHVNEMLGYEYFIYSKVVHGNHIGHGLGFPTINQIPGQGKMLPAFGVYASRVTVDGRVYAGVTNVGIKPTVNYQGQPLAETHIIGLDNETDLYEKSIKVALISYLRPEQKFDDLDALKKQLESDKKKASEVL